MAATLPIENAIRKAIASESVLTIEYEDRDGNVSAGRMITPLKLEDGKLTAYCHLREKLRLFVMDRIRDLQMADAGTPPAPGQAVPIDLPSPIIIDFTEARVYETPDLLAGGEVIHSSAGGQYYHEDGWVFLEGAWTAAEAVPLLIGLQEVVDEAVPIVIRRPRYPKMPTTFTLDPDAGILAEGRTPVVFVVPGAGDAGDVAEPFPGYDTVQSDDLDHARKLLRQQEPDALQAALAYELEHGRRQRIVAVIEQVIAERTT